MIFFNKKFRTNSKDETIGKSRLGSQSLYNFEGKPRVEVVSIVSFQADYKLVLLQNNDVDTGVRSLLMQQNRTVVEDDMLHGKPLLF